VSNLADLSVNVEAEHARRSGGRAMEAKQRLKEGGLAGAIGPEQTDAPSGVGAGQFLENRAASQTEAESVEFNKCHSLIRLQLAGTVGAVYDRARFRNITVLQNCARS
jgi:hypothetical protein